MFDALVSNKTWNSEYPFTIGGFCYAISHGKKESWDGEEEYGSVCKNGDVVTMVVDLNKMNLRYSVNDVCYGKAFDIDKDSYRVAVFMYEKANSIQLLHYNQL